MSCNSGTNDFNDVSIGTTSYSELLASNRWTFFADDDRYDDVVRSTRLLILPWIISDIAGQKWPSSWDSIRNALLNAICRLFKSVARASSWRVWIAHERSRVTPETSSRRRRRRLGTSCWLVRRVRRLTVSYVGVLEIVIKQRERKIKKNRGKEGTRGARTRTVQSGENCAWTRGSCAGTNAHRRRSETSITRVS